MPPPSGVTTSVQVAARSTAGYMLAEVAVAVDRGAFPHEEGAPSANHCEADHVGDEQALRDGEAVPVAVALGALRVTDDVLDKPHTSSLLGATRKG